MSMWTRWVGVGEEKKDYKRSTHIATTGAKTLTRWAVHVSCKCASSAYKPTNPPSFVINPRSLFNRPMRDGSAA